MLAERWKSITYASFRRDGATWISDLVRVGLTVLLQWVAQVSCRAATPVWICLRGINHMRRPSSGSHRVG